MKKKNALDVILAPYMSDKQIVSCNGGNPDLGHPKVFLKIPKDTKQIECPYCSRLFVFKGEITA